MILSIPTTLEALKKKNRSDNQVQIYDQIVFSVSQQCK